MAGFAFLFAPIAFAHVGPTPEFAATVAASVRAITVAGDVLGVLAALATLFIPDRANGMRIDVVALIAVAIACGVVETSWIVPQMQQTPLLTPAYESLHRQSSGVYALALLCALGAFVLSSVRRYR